MTQNFEEIFKVVANFNHLVVVLMKITDKKPKQENDQKIHQNNEVNFSKLNEHNNIIKRKNG